MPRGCTIVVVAHNSARHVAAVAAQLRRLPVGWTAVMVDNASTDGTAELAERHGLRVLRSASNRGFGAACNLGARAYPGEVLVFANPDVRVNTKALSLLVNAIRRGDAAFAGPVFGPWPCRTRRFSSIPRDLYGLGPCRLRGVLDRLSSGRWSDGEPIDMNAPIVPVDFPTGALLACNGEAFISLGGFDERYFLYSEEEDLCLRARMRGHRSVVVPGARATHAETTSSSGHDARSLSTVRIDSKLLFYRLHRGWVYAVCARLTIAALVASHDLAARARRRPSKYPARAAYAILRPSVARRSNALHTSGAPWTPRSERLSRSLQPPGTRRRGRPRP